MAMAVGSLETPLTAARPSPSPPRNVEYTIALAVGLILVTNPIEQNTPSMRRHVRLIASAVVGKSGDFAVPAMYALPNRSTAIGPGLSSPPAAPPRYVE